MLQTGRTSGARDHALVTVDEVMMNAQPSGGLPGLTHFDHIGFTVPDLEQATRFLVDVLGCEYLYSLGPYSPDGSWMSAHLNVGDASEIPEIRFFRCAGLPVFEVFEYRSPDQQLRPPRNSDVGGHHVALHVQDIDAAIDYLRERGVQVLGQPTASKGPHLGQRWVYFLSPWGMQFELVSYPHGRAFYLAEDQQHAATATTTEGSQATGPDLAG